MKSIVQGLVLILLSVTVVFSQTSTNPQFNECSEYIVSYKQIKTGSSPVFPLKVDSSSGGHLLYIGADRHSYDPTDFEFEEFEKKWNSFKPTKAFFEGSGSDIGISRDETIRRSGEPGLVRFLAARDKIPAVSLEPNLQSEANYLLTKFPVEQVKLFYVLREIAQLRERRRYSESDLNRVVPGTLERWSRLKGFESIIRDSVELEQAYRRYWKSPRNWWEASLDWFNPLKSSSQTGGVFTNEINQESSYYRNLHMLKTLSEATIKGDRVFAIVGRDHLPMQEAALKCAIK